MLALAVLWAGLGAAGTCIAQEVPAGEAEAPSAAALGFRVVIHPDNPQQSVSRDLLDKMFRKKVTVWTDWSGVRVLPVDQEDTSEVRELFTRHVHRVSLKWIRSYWQRNIFSGRGGGAVERRGDEEVLDYVRKNEGAVGYVSADVRGARLAGVKELRVEF